MNKRTFIKSSALLASSAFIGLPGTLRFFQPEERFQLPDLNYDYAALEPFIDAKTMTIHHGKHHQGYVNKLNAALRKSALQYASLEELLVLPELPAAIRNNGGGHYNHSLFWNVINPKPKLPSKTLEASVNSNFGNMEALETELHSKGMSVFGSGWVWLIQTPDGRLEVSITANQDNPLMSHVENQGHPLLGIDLWEHAYYLKYQNERNTYLKQILNLIDWQFVSGRLLT